jgi:hypothetical protein
MAIGNAELTAVGMYSLDMLLDRRGIQRIWVYLHHRLGHGDAGWGEILLVFEPSRRVGYLYL